nr:DUF3971 domain-containing protein [Roseomonas sp. GC11]
MRSCGWLCGWLGGALARLALALALLALLAAGALVWRLAQGPLPLPMVTELVQRALPDQGVTVGAVTLAWGGFHAGEGSPLHFQVSGVQLRDEAGAVRQSLPDATLTLSFVRLLRGQVVPLAIALRQPEIVLERQVDGSVALAMGQHPGLPGPSAGPAAGVLPDAPGGDVLRDLLRQGDAAHDSPLQSLRGVEIRDGRLAILDRQLGLTWQLERVNLALHRAADGQGIAGEGSAALQLPGHGDSLPVLLEGGAHGSGPVLEGRLILPALEPARIARLLPALAPLALVEGSARLELAGRFDIGQAEAAPELSLRLTAGPGAVQLPQHRLAFAGLRLEAQGTPTRLRLQRLRLELPAVAQETGSPHPAPVIEATGEARLLERRWHAGLELRLDQLQASDLGAYWPPGVAKGARHWIVENITQGLLRDGQFRLQAEASEDLSGLEVRQLDGTLRAEGATVHWLRPVPPVEGVAASIRFTLPEITIQVEGARQAGTALTSPGTTLRFYALDTPNEQAEIEARLRGPIPDVVALIRHPRLKLFERRPLDLKEPGGQMEGTLKLAFPLLEDIPSEALRVSVQAKLTQMRLADVVMGKRLERGTADLSVDNSRLRASGTAQLSGIPAQLLVEMDFRPGPPGQVVERIRAEGRPDAARIAEFGLDLDGFVAGPVAVQAVMEKRRSGEMTVSLTGDLRDSRMTLSPLAWGKPAGQPASAQAELRVANDSLRAVESFQVSAPDLSARGQVAMAQGGRVERITIPEARVFQGRMSVEARPPGQPGAPWRFRLSGPVLDLAAVMAAPDPAPGSTADGPPVVLEGNFDRVLLGPGRAVTAVQGRGAADARGFWREARLSGQAGPGGGFDLTIAPAGQGRELRLNAANAGALLRAFDVMQQVEGGRLRVSGRWPVVQPGVALSGTAEMDDFTVQEAEGIGKLLQALTVYGVFDAVRGPGLSFSRLVAPFSMTEETLSSQELRAFSPSLGVTAKGVVRRRAGTLDLEGTIVPAYVLNSLLGQIPLLGRLFSPEQGGGLFAATWRMQGQTRDPVVMVNPLAALTPGFLRGLFGGVAGQQPAPPTER